MGILLWNTIVNFTYYPFLLSQMISYCENYIDKYVGLNSGLKILALGQVLLERFYDRSMHQSSVNKTSDF